MVLRNHGQPAGNQINHRTFELIRSIGFISSNIVAVFQIANVLLYTANRYYEQAKYGENPSVSSLPEFDSGIETGFLDGMQWLVLTETIELFENFVDG